MRICILTQPLQTNYGGLLQAYALQKVLKCMGHEVWTENRKYDNPPKIISIKLRIRNLFSYLPLLKDKYKRIYIPNEKQKEIIRKNTDAFIENHIITTEAIYSYNKEVLTKYKFDAYVVGSDQVWRPRFSPNIFEYFLDFTESLNVKRIAYAVSFGTDKWEFSEKETLYCSKLSKLFDAVSVREDSGIHLCSKYLGIDSKLVLDPTLLLTKDDYKELLRNENRPDNDKKKLFTYILDSSLEKVEITKRLEDYYQLKSFSIMPNANFTQDGPELLNQCVFPPVYEWLESFDNSDFIFTDSFHGMVFSIIFNKPFIVIANKTRGCSRFLSLLNMLNLSNRLIYSMNDLTDDLMNSSIDFANVNKIISKQKELSFSFLKENLK